MNSDPCYERFPTKLSGELSATATEEGAKYTLKFKINNIGELLTPYFITIKI